jgi:hypothetical protein
MGEEPFFTRVKVMGERGSGTNFLSRLLIENFETPLVDNTSNPEGQDRRLIKRIPQELRRGARVAERVMEHYHRTQMPENAGWKHACLTERTLSTYQHTSETLFLCIIRHPALWLRSFYDRPFHAMTRKPDSLDAFIDTPWITLSCDEIEGVVLESPVALWRLKTLSYLDRAAAHPNVRVVRHEDLLRDHAAGLADLVPMLGVPRHKEWRLSEGYARSWLSKLKGGEDFEAIRAALPEDPFSILSPSQAEKVGGLVGEDVLVRAGYGGAP